VKNTTVATPETTVTAAKKTVSVRPTVVCKVLSIGFLIVEQSFANPKLVFLELQPARIIINSGNSPADPINQPQLHHIYALNFLSSFLYYPVFLSTKVSSSSLRAIRSVAAFSFSGRLQCQCTVILRYYRFRKSF